MRRLLFICVFTMLCLAACGGGGDQDASSSTGVKIAASTPLQWPHVWVAEELGMWQDGDISVETTLFQEGAQALQALTAGGVDIATAAPTPLVAAIHSGQEIRVLAVTDRWSNWRIVANKSKGIASPDDLKGKKIGVPLGTAAEVSLTKFLADEGLSADDVELVNIAPPSIAAALANGSVDAVNVWVPHIVNAERQLGDNSISFPYEFSSNYLLITTQAVLDEKSEELSKALAVFSEANQYINQDPQDAAKRIEEVAGIDAETLADIWTSEFTFEVAAPDDAVRAEFEANIEFAKEKGTIPQDSSINLEDVFVDVFTK